MPNSHILHLEAAHAPQVLASKHPNRMRLRGILVRLDEPSNKPPHGSDGHRILVTTEVARAKLSTLVGMGLNYAPDMKRHAQRRKVGVITKAWIDGKDLRVEATVWKRDFPEAERDLKRAGLGMSMEIGDVSVSDQNAKVWVLSDFCFLGATVLEKTAAAYFHTQAIAAAKSVKESGMAKVATKKVVSGSMKEVAEIAAAATRDAVRELLEPVIESQSQIMVRLDALEADGDVEEVDAEDDDTEACGDMSEKEKVAAAKRGGDDDGDECEDDEDDEMESEGVDKGDLTDMGPEADTGDDKPGKLGGKENKGHKTSCEDKLGKTVASARLAASLKRERATSKQLFASYSTIKDLKKRMKAMEDQVKAAGTAQARRTVLPSEIRSLLGKGGVDVEDLAASGEKLSVDQVDAILDSMHLPGVKRIEFKSLMVANGLMDEGRVVRHRQ